MSARKMKDSGIEWIGEIPEEWEVCKIKYLATMKSGESIGASEIANDGKYPVYGGNGLRGYTSAYTHDGKYILIGRQGALCGNVRSVEGKFWATEHAVVVYEYNNVDINWFKYSLDAMNLNQYSTSAAQPGLSVEQITNILSCVPPFFEQKAIAVYLDEKCASIDKIVASKQKQNEQLAEYRQSLITEAVTKGLNSSVLMKDSGIEWIGKIPKEWKIKKLRYLGEFSSNGVDKKIVEGEDTYKSVHYMDVYQNSMQEIGNNDNYLVVSATKLKAANCELKKGDAIFTNSSETPEDIGHSTVVKEDLDNTLMGYHLMRFRPSEELSYKYGKYLFGSIYVRRSLAKRANGITRYGISYIDFADILIPYPNVTVQKAIAAYLDEKCGEIDALRGRNKKIIESLQEYKQSLIYEAVTGKIEL